jgi:hypothetical protein
VARRIVRDSLVRRHDITYNVANGEPMHSCGSIELDVRIVFDDLTNDIENLLNLRFDIVDNLDLPDADCLISQRDIYDAALLVRIPNYSGIPKDLSDLTGRIPCQPRKFYTCAITRAMSNFDRMHVSEFFDFEQEDMGVPEKEDSIDEALQEKSPTVEEPSQPAPIIEGPESLQKALRALVAKYIDLLQSEVSKEPARVAPLKLNVDETRWTLPGAKNTQRYRTQSAAKDKEIRRQVDLMEALGLIRRSTQTRRSQVHLVPKPNGKWRFCIDFRYLNECSEMEGGVLPRIKELLHRIGERKARYFAVMDLTSGYHQTAIDEDSMKYTAFVTSAGVFEWRRVPMGLKGAPTYFQREMAQTVLAGIIGYGAELYIDDCIVYGETEEEFLANLESVFEKFKAHNITLNPKNCRFGQSAIEYLGQIIDKDGLRFSREKLDGVLNFNTPIVIKDLQKFIGLVNWFRDHIPNLSEEMKLLREMEDEAKKTRKLRWTDERRSQFERLKKMFNDLQALYFLVEGGTVKVYTDASLCNRGICLPSHQWERTTGGVHE